MAVPRSFWFTNQVANPVLRLLLRSPVGGRLGRHLALLGYEGRRTGVRHELVVEYVRDGDTVWIKPAMPERKTWWRNLRGGAPVRLRLAGADVDGLGTALEEGPHSAEVARGAAIYASRRRRASGDHARTPDVPPVMVRVDLGPR